MPQIVVNEMATLRARVTKLLQANNEFEARARKAERELREAHVEIERLRRTAGESS